MADRSSSPIPGDFKITLGECACMPKIPREEWRRRDCGVVIPLGGMGDFSLFLSLSLSLFNEYISPRAKENF